MLMFMQMDCKGLMIQRTNVDANGFSFYIWRRSHLRRKGGLPLVETS